MKIFERKNKYESRRDVGDRDFSGREFAPRETREPRSFGGGKSFEKKSTHKATCSQCGQSCEVPFRPTGARPVFCDNCFNRGDNSAPRKSRFDAPQRFDRRDAAPAARPQGPDPVQKQLAAINAKLDQILELLSEEEYEDDDE